MRSGLPAVVGLRCASCGSTVDIADPFSWRCPRAIGGDRHHVLQQILGPAPTPDTGDENPFLAFRSLLGLDGFAAANGLTDLARVAVIAELDEQVAAVAGVGFRITPFGRADALSAELGFTGSGGVWVKDETGNVAGSHKARHLFTILAHLRVAELRGLAPWASPADRPALAISSCGNAAIAAATLAASVGWPLRVFVPPSASRTVIATLTDLGASIDVCPRLVDDPPGDPCVHRFRESVAGGAIPFTVQGPENAWCLDGGRTIGWEMVRQFASQTNGGAPDRVIVQVGGGAFAACVGAAMPGVQLVAVQTAGCAPLDRAWRLLRAQRDEGSTALWSPGGRWAELMWPWETEPHSLADGILDDETYDWIGVVDALRSSGGTTVVVDEPDVVRAQEVARRLTDVAVSPTGSAGLAGLLAIRDQVADDERVAVVFSGVDRGT